MYWHWPGFSKTKLGTYYLNMNKNLYGSPHEGLCLSHKACKKIIEFLESHQDIKEDLFKARHCVEEFGLQTISVNENEPYYYIGNGTGDETISANSSSNIIKKFMYKVSRT